MLMTRERDLFLTLFFFFATLSFAQPTFPIKVSANGRYLEDAAGVPFTIHADTPWSLIVQISRDDAIAYLDDRKQKGFNTLIVNLIEHEYGDRAPNTINNVAPFLVPGDLSTPNDAYFSYAKSIVDLAAQRGFLVLLTPSYFGYGGGSSGWWSEITNSGPAKCFAYGQYLGNLFKQNTNIGWIFGGDYSPPAGSTGELNAVETAKGLKAADRADRLYTYHGIRRTNATDQIAFRPYINVNAVYSGTGIEVYQRCLNSWTTSTLPNFIIEAWYENEHGMTPYQLRQQAYWAFTTCASGQAFGNAPIWYFYSTTAQAFADNRSITWQQSLNSAGSLDFSRLGTLIKRFQTAKLQPDTNHQIVISGYGSFGATNYATTAMSNTGDLAITYLPAIASLTLNLAWFNASVYLTWFDPTSGELSAIPGSPFGNAGSHVAAPGGTNSAGASDWVLIASTQNPLISSAPGAPRNLGLSG